MNKVQHPVPYDELVRLVELATTTVIAEGMMETNDRIDDDAKMLMRYRDMLGMNPPE